MPRAASNAALKVDVAEDFGDREIAVRAQAMENLFASVMMVDRDLNITYVNAGTKALLTKYAAEFRTIWPNFDPNNIVGQCIDQFHKNPAHQRKLLADPRNLPHTAQISVGPLRVNLSITAVVDADGEYIGNSLEWNVEDPAVRVGAIRSQAMENLFASVMMVDRNLNITYVNNGTKALLTRHAATLRTIWPSFDPNKIVGQCIDQFHKDPSHQRRILGDPANLPHTAEITIGPLKITLNITGIFDADGAYVGNCLEWEDVTERRAQEATNADYTSQLQAISKAQAVIEFNMDGTIREANANFLTALGYTIEEIRGQHHRMFVDPDEHGGAAYREFWDSFARGESKIGQFKRVAKGGRVIWIQASYNPITGADGKVFKVVKYASDVTPQRQTAERVKEIANIVSSASSEMRATAEQLSSTAEEATQQASAVTNAAQVASNNVQTVSAAGEELSASISEIARQVAESTNITQQAVIETDNTKAAIQNLAEAAQKIGNVVTLINNIAGQTKLLALNATIEAARAGDAGKGFAVVASEVKSLSDQTAKATHEISSEVSAMQAATSTSVSAIQGIAETIGKVSQIATAIASAVEEQSAATGEIATNVTEAASSTQEVSTNIQGLSDGVGQTSAASAQLLTAAGELAHQAEALSSEMDNLTR